MPEDPASASSPPPPAWAAYGTEAEDEDFIVGSPAGLRALRDHIDQAIQNGVSVIEDTKIQFNGIRCKDSPEDVPTESRWSPLAGYGCFAFTIAILALALYGFVSLFG